MKGRIDALTSTRAVAALLVVVFHFGCTVFPFNLQEHFFRRGNLAVGFFFVLSGFVMQLSYGNKQVEYGDFIRRRVARIWPLYMFAILLALAYPAYQYIKAGAWQSGLLTSSVLNATLLQAYIPGQALTVNSPGWSLSVEMFFYLLFPLLLLWARRDRRQFAVFAWLLFIVSQAVHLWMVHYLKPVYPSALHEFTYYHPVFHLNQFAIGMLGALYLHNLKLERPVLSAVIVLCCIVLLINYLPSSVSLHNGLLAPLYLVFIVLVTQLRTGPLLWRPWVFLGEISYGIYILQEPLHFYYTKINVTWLHLPEATFFYTYVFLLLLLASVCYYLIEIPFRRMLLR